MRITKQIRIFLEAGEVREVRGVPQDVEVYIYEYGVEEPNDIDASGKPCFITKYPGEPNPPHRFSNRKEVRQQIKENALGCNCVRFYDGSPHHKNCPSAKTETGR